jgi:AcrR family transcriptional regulator
MQKKDFKEISITDIVKLADLNRGTFYKHYQYKEDVLNEIIDDVITDLIASYREPYRNRDTFEVSNLTSNAIKVFEHVNKHANFIN